MLDLTQIARSKLQTRPYAWTTIDGLFTPRDTAALARTFPCDHFKTVSGHGGEKDYDYEARSLIRLGTDSVSNAAQLSGVWLELAHDLLSPSYRTAMSLLTALDLTSAPLEVNVCHYGPGASLGPHLDLPEKIVTHVLYFNSTWDRAAGGCLSILRSRDPDDVACQVIPTAGNSAVLIRSDRSWHAVPRVVEGCRISRRSMTVTFYRSDSASSMWPPNDPTPLHNCSAPDLSGEFADWRTSWARRLRRLWGGTSGESLP
jgi:hypothetical protein